VTVLTRGVAGFYGGGSVVFCRGGHVAGAELAEVAALASSGAGTLVTLMVTDGWAQAKEKFARVLGRRRGDAQAVAVELEESRAQLTQAQAQGDEQAAADVAAEWRSRLRRLLLEDPETGTLLKELLEQFAADAARPSATTEIHHNTFHGPTPIHTGLGDQHNTFGAPAS
jgi:hypothetical protein